MGLHRPGYRIPLPQVALAVLAVAAVVVALLIKSPGSSPSREAGNTSADGRSGGAATTGIRPSGTPAPHVPTDGGTGTGRGATPAPPVATKIASSASVDAAAGSPDADPTAASAARYDTDADPTAGDTGAQPTPRDRVNPGSTPAPRRPSGSRPGELNLPVVTIPTCLFTC